MFRHSFGTLVANSLLWVIVLHSVLASLARANLTEGLLGYWPFDGDGADVSGNNRPLDIVGGATFGDGLFGQSLDLHGDRRQFAVRPIVDGAFNFGMSDFTIQIWVNFESSTNREQTLIEQYDLDNWPFVKGWTVTTFSEQSMLWDGAAHFEATFSGSPVGQWGQIVVRRSSSLFQATYNDVVIGSMTAESAISTAASPLLIGRRVDDGSGGNPLIGRLDEVAIWNRALTDDEVNNLYHDGNGLRILSTLAGDSNGDGQVDLDDFAILKAHFGTGGTLADGDFDGNGRIDLSDFGLLKANFGKSAAAAVPEPAAWLLALLAAVGWALAYLLRWSRTQSSRRPSYFFTGKKESAKAIGRTQRGSAFISRLPATIVLAMGVADATNANAALVSYWAGEGNANDSVGANSGILQDGVTFGPGVVGQAFQFDGNSYVEAPTLNLPTGHHNRTLSLWFEIEQRDDDHESFFAGYGKFGTYNATYHLGSLADGRVFFSQWGLGESRLAVGKGEWHHLAVTNVGYLATLYLDGTDVGTQNFGGAIETARGSSFYLGRIPGELGDVRRLKGFVDEVRVYDTALSASEIAALAERSSLLPGDANGDGTVDLADFGILKANFGSGTTLAQGDFDGDSQVGLSDFGILKDNFGKSGATAVPEPAALALLATGLLCLGVHRLRRSGNAA